MKQHGPVCVLLRAACAASTMLLACSAGAADAPSPFGQITSIKPMVSSVGNANALSLGTNSETAPAAGGELEMYVGESRIFPAPGVARIAVGSGGVMTATAIDGKDVLLFANAPGSTTLFIWNSSGLNQQVKVSVTAGDTARIAREIAAFIAAMPGARTSIIGDKVIIEGDDLSDVELAKIDALSKSYPQVVNFTNKLGWEQMVLLDVKIVEFPISKLREVGMTWSPIGGAAVAGIWSPFRRGQDGPYSINIPAGENGAPIQNPEPDGKPVQLTNRLNILSGINMGIEAQLNLLAQEGKATILSAPQLSARNGSEATFLAGGELPYTVSSINGPTVLFKPYGIRLAIQPRVNQSGAIRATIDSEVSSIDNSVTTPSGPALLTRQTKTEFNVLDGDTIVLSGLVSRDQSNDIDKLPLLGDIPIIGALFRSKRFRNQETELVVFVTPRVIDSRTPDLVERVEQTRQRLQARLGPAPYLSDPLQPQRGQPVFKPAESVPPAHPSLQAMPAPEPRTPVTMGADPAEFDARQGAADVQPHGVVDSGTPAASQEPQPEQHANQFLVKAPRQLALRGGPSPEHRVLRYLSHGTHVVAMSQDAAVDGWLHVLVHDGRTVEDGWLDQRWLIPGRW